MITIENSTLVFENNTLVKCKGNAENIIISEGVKRIKERAFSECNNLVSIIIPESVIEIGEQAFGDWNTLTNIFVDPNNPVYASKDGVLFDKEFSKIICYPPARKGVYHIPDSVTEISEWAFWLCTRLTGITIPKSVTKIGEDAFCYCIGLTEIKLPVNLTEIGKKAFQSCENITKIMIPDSVTQIGEDAFCNCKNITKLFVDPNNTIYAEKDGVLFNKDFTKLIYCPAGKQGEYTIPDGITEIGNNAFRGCISLTAIYIPDSVISIGNSAFMNCTHLTKITIPNGVKTIGNNAFWNCKRLECFSVAPNNDVFAVKNGVLFNKDFSKIICYPSAIDQNTYTVPEGVKEIGAGTFTFCDCLTEIVIPDGVTGIGQGAFRHCKNLKSIRIPDSVTEIKKNAFWDDKKLIIRASAHSYTAQHMEKYYRGEHDPRFEEIE